MALIDVGGSKTKRGALVYIPPLRFIVSLIVTWTPSVAKVEEAAGVQMYRTIDSGEGVRKITMNRSPESV